MIDHFFVFPHTCQRMHEGPLGCHIDDYARLLHDQGYSRPAARDQIRLVADLSRWLQRQGLGARDLHQPRIAAFLRSRQRPRVPHRSTHPALRRLFELLRGKNILPPEPSPPVPHPRELVEDQFRRYLSEERGLAPPTLLNYLPFIQQFLLERFGSDSIQLAHLHATDVTGFVHRHCRDHSPGRTALMVTALRSFLRFLCQRGDIATDLAACVPTVANWKLATLPKFLQPEQVQRVLDRCDRRVPGGQRNYAILLLLARLGLRAGEVVALTLDDLHWHTGELTLRGKRGRLARLPLPQDVGAAIAIYLQQARPRCASRRLFIRMRAPLTGFANSIVISTIVKRALQHAGVDSPHTGAHLFRHSLATHMLQRGASLADIGHLLRHQHVNTTALYAKVDLGALRHLAQPWIGGGL